MTFINPKFIPASRDLYLVGGCVRDRLLGRSTSDYDLAAGSDPEGIACQIASAAGSRVVKMGGREKGTVIYRVVTGEASYDVSLIKGQDIEADLVQRDFTVNAMAVNTATQQLADPCGGRRDLSGGKIRMTAAAAFDRDPLRMLRAFRLAAVLGFWIEETTLEAISERAEKISSAAGERIREEWLMLLQSPLSADMVDLADRAGLLCAVFPELLAQKGCGQNSYHSHDVFRHTMAVYRAAEKLVHENVPSLNPAGKNIDLFLSSQDPRLFKHAALFHDIGKPEVRRPGPGGRVHFYDHDRKGAEILSAINRRLRFSNRQDGYSAFLVKSHLRPLHLYILHRKGKLGPRAEARFFMKTSPQTPDVLMLAAADSEGKDPVRAEKFIGFAAGLVRRYLERHLPARGRPRLLTGNDLKTELGLEPSPAFSVILEKTEEMRLAGLLETRQQALEYARKLIRETGGKGS